MIESPSTPKLLTLDSIKSQFSQWRSTHGKGKKIPSTLWNAVKELTKSYSYQQLSSELQISPSRLRKKCERLPHDAPLPIPSPFVQVPLPPLFPSPQEIKRPKQKHLACAGTLELIRKDGTSLKISEVENKSLLSIVQEFLKQ